MIPVHCPSICFCPEACSTIVVGRSGTMEKREATTERKKSITDTKLAHMRTIILYFYLRSLTSILIYFPVVCLSSRVHPSSRLCGGSLAVPAGSRGESRQTTQTGSCSAADTTRHDTDRRRSRGVHTRTDTHGHARTGATIHRALHHTRLPVHCTPSASLVDPHCPPPQRTLASP